MDRVNGLLPAANIVCQWFDPFDVDITVDVAECTPRVIIDPVVAVLRTLPEDRQPSELNSDGEPR